MKISNLTIRTRIYLYAAILALFCLTGIILTYNFIHRATGISAATANYGKIHPLLHAMDASSSRYLSFEIQEGPFYASTRSIHMNELDSILRSMSILSYDIQHSKQVKASREVIALLTGIHSDMETYLSKTLILEKNILERGNYRFGLTNDWIKQGDFLREIAVQIDHPALIKETYQLGLNEKEYQKKPDARTLEQIIQSASTLKVNILTNKFLDSPTTTTIDKLKLVTEIDQYNEYSKLLINKDRLIGFTGKTGLIQDREALYQVISTKAYELEQFIEPSIRSKSRKTFYFHLGIILAWGIILGGFLVLFRESLFRTIDSLKQYIHELSQGKLPTFSIPESQNEITSLGDTLSVFAMNLREKVQFAREMDSGNISNYIEPLSEHDILAISLLDMEKSLRKAEEEDKKYKEDEARRNWANEGLALFGEVLRTSDGDIRSLCDNVLRTMVKYLEANQGGIFLAQDEQENPDFELVSAFAYDRKKFTTRVIRPGEGLVGACVLEMQPIYMTEIPAEYISITSGLGDGSPKSLLITPLKLETKLFGIMEIASFKELLPHELEFVQKVAENIASALSSTQMSMRTNLLLEQSRKQAEEMAQQEEEMRQNMEELQATQEESARKQAELASILEAVDASTSVIEYDPSGRVREVNKKFCLLARSHREILLGKHHHEIFSWDQDQGKQGKDFWDTLVPGQTVSRIEYIELADKRRIWFKKHLTPAVNSDGQVVKVLEIAIDITESKEQEGMLAQQALEMDKKNTELSSLHESINEAIVRAEYSPEGIVLDCNENYCSLTGFSLEEMQGKDTRLFRKPDEIKQLDIIFTEVLKGKIYHGVIKRTKPTGEESWIVANFYPRKKQHEKIERVICFAQDITEKKLRYKLLEEANKEIERLKAQLDTGQNKKAE